MKKHRLRRRSHSLRLHRCLCKPMYRQLFRRKGEANARSLYLALPAHCSAGSQGPTSKPTDFRHSRRFATKCSSDHCGGSSNSACPNTSAGGRFIAKEPPRLTSWLAKPPLFASEASVCDSDRYPEGRDTRRVARWGAKRRVERGPKASPVCHQHVNIALLRELLPRERGSCRSNPKVLASWSCCSVSNANRMSVTVRPSAQQTGGPPAKGVHACRQLRHVHPARCRAMVWPPRRRP